MKNSVTTFLFKHFKGFFSKKLAGEYVLLFLVTDTMILIFQFLAEADNGNYYIAITNAITTRDEDYVDEIIDKFQYSKDIEVLEMKTPAKISLDKGIKIKFSKKSSIFMSDIEIFPDSRLPEGIFFAKTKMKKGMEPAVKYSKDSKEGEIEDLGALKGMMNVSKSMMIKNFLHSGDNVNVAKLL